MSEEDRPEEKLERVVAGLENFSLQHEMTEPRRRRAIAELIKEAKAALTAMELSERRQRKQERRLAELIARFEEMDHEPAVFQPSQAVREEGRYVSEQLGRLGDFGTAPVALKDAEPNSAPSGLELLAAAVNSLSPEREVD